MNFCPKCGTSVQSGTRFCPNCGFDLQVKGATPATPTPAASVTPQPQGQPQTQPQAQFQQQATMAAPMPRTAAGGAIDYQSNLGIIGAFKQFMHEYAKFGGRMSRANYWWAFLATVLISGVTGVLAYFMNSEIPTYINYGFLLPSLSSLVRRLHDSNLSGGNFFWDFIPFVGWIYLVILLCKPGDQQANRFG